MGMEQPRFYIVHGIGNDAVGLVGRITAPIGQAGGNVVDLRQDVLHGLFTIHMVVDLSATQLRLDDLAAMVRNIGEDTGLKLYADKYLPVPPPPDKKNLLLILLGSDRPGIIASVSEILGRYRANIELAQAIAREDLFLLELITDVSHCRIPLPNLMSSIEKTMSEMKMKTIFQTEDVFNKKKRVILFDLESSFIDPSLRAEIIRQTALDAQALAEVYGQASPRQCVRQALARLDGFPADVMATLTEGVSASSGTMELIQTLMTMGYRIVLVSRALSLLTDHLKSKLGLDYAFGVPTRIDEDSRSLVGELSDEDFAAALVENVTLQVAAAERVEPSDITIVSDADTESLPGIRLEFDLGQLLHLYNQRVISQDHMIGILGSFGVPRSGS
jgi:phosphoserine phosphatase